MKSTTKNTVKAKTATAKKVDESKAVKTIDNVVETPVVENDIADVVVENVDASAEVNVEADVEVAETDGTLKEYKKPMTVYKAVCKDEYADDVWYGDKLDAEQVESVKAVNVAAAVDSVKKKATYVATKLC